MDCPEPFGCPSCGVVVLLGPPGCGKSTLGRALAKTHLHTVHSVLNVGLELRKAGHLEHHFQHPTAAGRDELRKVAQELLEEACRDLQQRFASNRHAPLASTTDER